MKRLFRLLLLVISGICLLTSCVTSEIIGTPPSQPAASEAVTGRQDPSDSKIALYLGVKDYGQTETVNKENADAFEYRFYIRGTESLYHIPVDAGDRPYALQNRLEEGCFYRIAESDGVIRTLTRCEDGEDVLTGVVKKVEDGSFSTADRTVVLPSGVPVIAVSPEAGGVLLEPAALKRGDAVFCELIDGSPERVFVLPAPAAYVPPVSGKAGLKTLKNFLATAMTPVGVCNYVFGGGWDWQDEGSGPQSVTIGMPASWPNFFFRQDDTYSYRDPYGDETLRDKAHSYCPFGEFNEYYYAGLDCAGYLAWTAYNVMQTQSGLPGYVVGGTPTALSFSENGWGTFTQTFSPTDFYPGSVMSINGHVWICVGRCDDGSMLIAHASPTKSKAGCPGGGVQLSALGPSRDCRAYKLAFEYMTLFYPAWAARYDVSLFSYEYYTSFEGEVAGLFTWDLENGPLTDPDGFRDLSAGQILAELFDYESILEENASSDSDLQQEGTNYEENTGT